jgi:hypothetical protein
MAAGILWWLVGTTCLGGVTLWRTGMLVSRLRAISAQVRRCPRGHEVAVYGLWDCACGSRFEGWAFTPCQICHETAAYVPCPVCGLPLRNPLLV